MGSSLALCSVVQIALVKQEHMWGFHMRVDPMRRRKGLIALRTTRRLNDGASKTLTVCTEGSEVHLPCEIAEERVYRDSHC